MPNIIKHNPYDKMLLDKSLSLGAKGLLAITLSSRKQEFEISDYCSDSEIEINRVIDELINKHYIKYGKDRNIFSVSDVPSHELDNNNYEL